MESLLCKYLFDVLTEYESFLVKRLLKAKLTLIRRHWSHHRELGKYLFMVYVLARAVAFTAAAQMVRRPALVERAKTWTEVWTRRGQWAAGYEDLSE